MISLLLPEYSSWEGKIFFGILGFSWATYFWDEYLAYRQRRVYRENSTPPKEIEEITDAETFEKSRLYGIDKSKFGLIEGGFSQLFSTGVMLCGGIPAIWDISGRVVEYLGYGGTSEIPQTLAFVTLGSFFTTLISIPWSAYFSFVIEEKYGFNKQTPGFFVKDKIKKYIVSQVIMSPVVAGLVYIIKVGGDYFFIYLWGFTTCVMFFFMTIYPDHIAPLFDKYELLPEGELKEKIEALAKQLSFPLTKLYVVEGSKRSAHSNAYLYGFFNNKRIVLYDTLLEDYTPLNKAESEGEETSSEQNSEEKKKKKTGCNTEEVLAVLGHELGHWKLSHVAKMICISQANLFMMFFAFGSLYRYSPLFRAFGFHHSQPAVIGLILILQFVFAPYSELLNFFVTAFVRHNEFQADAFACELDKGEKLKAALIKLNNDNLSFPVYDHLYSTWHHSHPPILQRMQAIDENMKKHS